LTRETAGLVLAADAGDGEFRVGGFFQLLDGGGGEVAFDSLSAGGVEALDDDEQGFEGGGGEDLFLVGMIGRGEGHFFNEVCEGGIAMDKVLPGGVDGAVSGEEGASPARAAAKGTVTSKRRTKRWKRRMMDRSFDQSSAVRGLWLRVVWASRRSW